MPFYLSSNKRGISHAQQSILTACLGTGKRWPSAEEQCFVAEVAGQFSQSQYP